VLPTIDGSLVILHVRVTVDAPTTSATPRDYTVKSCARLSQTTLGWLLLQVLTPQAGGFVMPEVASPKAGIVVAM
jgi:hypothetical protein